MLTLESWCIPVVGGGVLVFYLHKVDLFYAGVDSIILYKLQLYSPKYESLCVFALTSFLFVQSYARLRFPDVSSASYFTISRYVQFNKALHVSVLKHRLIFCV